MERTTRSVRAFTVAMQQVGGPVEGGRPHGDREGPGGRIEPGR
jgi:hypothetical protein